MKNQTDAGNPRCGGIDARGRREARVRGIPPFAQETREGWGTHFRDGSGKVS